MSSPTPTTEPKVCNIGIGKTFKTQHPCPVCGNKARAGRTTCSLKCRNSYWVKENIRSWGTGRYGPGLFVSDTGYYTVYKDGRRRKQHLVIAEAALGRKLPAKAMVHHVDGNPLNNANSNLVICENMAYHKLLHARQRVQNAGGNPRTEKVCSICGVIKLYKYFRLDSARKATGRSPVCSSCARAYEMLYRAKRRSQTEQRAV